MTDEEIIKQLDEEFDKAEDKEAFLMELIDEVYGDKNEHTRF